MLTITNEKLYHKSEGENSFWAKWCTFDDGEEGMYISAREWDDDDLHMLVKFITNGRYKGSRFEAH